MRGRPWNVRLRHAAPLVAVLGLLGPAPAAAEGFGPDTAPTTALLAPDPAPVAATRQPAARSPEVVAAPVGTTVAPRAPRTTPRARPRPTHATPAVTTPVARRAPRPEPRGPRPVVAAAVRALDGARSSTPALVALAALAGLAAASGLGTIAVWRRWAGAER